MSKFLDNIKSRLSGKRVVDHGDRVLEFNRESKPDEFRTARELMDTRVSIGIMQAVAVGSKQEYAALELKAAKDIAHLVYGDVIHELNNLRLVIRDISMERGYQLDRVLDGVDNVHALMRP